jgi:hypothetical protein
MMAKHSPAPWASETIQGRDDRTAYEVVRDANGKILFDTINADVTEIRTEYDGGSAYRWDELGRNNLRLAAAAPVLLAACKAWDEGFAEGEQFTAEQFRTWVNERRRMARAAIAEATEF